MATENHEQTRVPRNHTYARLVPWIPNEGIEEPRTEQLNGVVRLNPMKVRIVDPMVNSLAMKYTTNDHFHGRLPVNTSHSKSSVVKYSHLW